MDNSMANGIIDWCISVVKGKTEAEEKGICIRPRSSNSKRSGI